MNPKLSACLKLAVIPFVGMLAACGGSSGGSSATSSDSATLSGTVVAAPVSGASVLVKDTAGNTIAGPVITAADGSYSVQVPNAHLASALVLESSGGTFTDEATGLPDRAAGFLAVHIPANGLSGSAKVHLTPATTIVRHMVLNGLTLDAARIDFEEAFGFPADFSDAPIDATDATAAAGATDAEKLAGLRAAIFSQLTMDMPGYLAPEDQFDLLTALAEDLADGTLDGGVTVGDVVLPADIQNQFAEALQEFHGGSKDQTGLTSVQIGTLPFARHALSSSYRFEYFAGMMAAMEGKTQFKVRVTDVATGSTPQEGLALTLKAKMHMATMTHMTPVDGCSESATTPGTYDCTLYYLMPSVMGDTSMGYWELMVTANTETVTFFPSVGMGMNGNGKHQLKGQLDLIPGMMGGTEQRPYYLFKDTITGMTNDHTVRLFIAASDGMAYPALFLDQSYNELIANPITVHLSTDGIGWAPMAGEGNGYWNITGVTGLTNDVENTFYVRLTVNLEQKTTDGKVENGIAPNDQDPTAVPELIGNEYTTFTTTITSM